MSAGTTRAGLIGRLSLADAPALVPMAAAVFLAVLLSTLLPRSIEAFAADELRYSLSSASATARDLTGTAPFGSVPAAADPTATVDTMFGGVQRTLDSLRSSVDAPLASVLSPPQWYVATSPSTVVYTDAETRNYGSMLALAVDPSWSARIRIVEGAAPGSWTGEDGGDAVDPAPQPPIPVAISDAAASRLGIAVGDIVRVGAFELVVSGTYVPAEPGDGYWEHASDLATYTEVARPGAPVLVRVGAYIAPESALKLRDTLSRAHLQAWYPIAPSAVHLSDVGALTGQLRKLAVAGLPLPTGETLAFSVGPVRVLESVVDRLDVARGLVALIATGPLGVALCAVAIAASSLADRRRAALTLVRARGGSGSQIRSVLAVEVLAVAGPAALLGAATAAFAVPGVPSSLVVTATVIAASVLTPMLVAVSRVPRAMGVTRRADITGRTRRGIRGAIELLVVLLAIGAAVLLLRRGPISDGSPDPIVDAAPVLFAAAATIGALRLYPMVMGVIQRGALGGSSAAAAVGAARAVRAPSLGFPAALGVVTAVSIAVFSVGMWATLHGALGAAQPADRLVAPLDPRHPLVAGVDTALASAVIASLLFASLAVYIAAVAAARTRMQSIGVLRVLGFGARQLRAVVAWELAPVAVLAILVGMIVGLVELAAVSTVLDIPALVGTEGSPRIVVAPVAMVAVAGAFAVSVAAAAVLSTAWARRGPLAAGIRMGME